MGPGSSLSAGAGAFQPVGPRSRLFGERTDKELRCVSELLLSQPTAAPRAVPTNTLTRGAEPRESDGDTRVDAGENRADEKEE